MKRYQHTAALLDPLFFTPPSDQPDRRRTLHGGGSGGGSGMPYYENQDKLLGVQADIATNMYNLYANYAPDKLNQLSTMANQASSEGYREQLRGQAVADTQAANSQAMQQYQNQMAGLGVTPGSGNYQDQANKMSLAGAANVAGAMNNANKRADDTAWARTSDVYSVLSGMPANASASLASAASGYGNMGNAMMNANMANAQGYGQVGGMMAKAAFAADGGYIHRKKRPRGGLRRKASNAPKAPGFANGGMPTLGDWRQRSSSVQGISSPSAFGSIVAGAVPVAATSMASDLLKPVTQPVKDAIKSAGQSITNSFKSAVAPKAPTLANSAGPATPGTPPNGSTVGNGSSPPPTPTPDGAGSPAPGLSTVNSAADTTVGAASNTYEVGAMNFASSGAADGAATTAASTGVVEGGLSGAMGAISTAMPYVGAALLLGKALNIFADGGPVPREGKSVQGGRKNFLPGGRVSGPGTETSDSIPAWLSDGEYVLNADAVKLVGKDKLDRMNQAGLKVRRLRAQDMDPRQRRQRRRGGLRRQPGFFDGGFLGVALGAGVNQYNRMQQIDQQQQQIDLNKQFFQSKQEDAARARTSQEQKDAATDALARQIVQNTQPNSPSASSTPSTPSTQSDPSTQPNAKAVPPYAPGKEPKRPPATSVMFAGNQPGSPTMAVTQSGGYNFLPGLNLGKYSSYGTLLPTWTNTNGATSISYASGGSVGRRYGIHRNPGSVRPGRAALSMALRHVQETAQSLLAGRRVPAYASGSLGGVSIDDTVEAGSGDPSTANDIETLPVTSPTGQILPLNGAMPLGNDRNPPGVTPMAMAQGAQGDGQLPPAPGETPPRQMSSEEFPNRMDEANKADQQALVAKKLPAPTEPAPAAPSSPTPAPTPIPTPAYEDGKNVSRTKGYIQALHRDLPNNPHAAQMIIALNDRLAQDRLTDVHDMLTAAEMTGDKSYFNRAMNQFHGGDFGYTLSDARTPDGKIAIYATDKNGNKTLVGGSPFNSYADAAAHMRGYVNNQELAWASIDDARNTTKARQEAANHALASGLAAGGNRSPGPAVQGRTPDGGAVGGKTATSDGTIEPFGAFQKSLYPKEDDRATALNAYKLYNLLMTNATPEQRKSQQYVARARNAAVNAMADPKNRFAVSLDSEGSPVLHVKDTDGSMFWVAGPSDLSAPNPYTGQPYMGQDGAAKLKAQFLSGLETTGAGGKSLHDIKNLTTPELENMRLMASGQIMVNGKRRRMGTSPKELEAQRDAQKALNAYRYLHDPTVKFEPKSPNAGSNGSGRAGSPLLGLLAGPDVAYKDVNKNVPINGFRMNLYGRDKSGPDGAAGAAGK